ncbi:MAG TPA: alpha/beta hydrolase [Aggregicoccus sp.]|nr:alpha/beta hydrolase [Aggregicoccus sp.]
MTPTALDLPLATGTLRALRYGDAGAPLLLCVHGLSANAHSFGAIAPVLSVLGYQVVAVDLRGRGHSSRGAPGSHGWPAHARDLLEAARLLGAERFGLVGHSMGAYVSLALLGLASERVERVALIDALSPPEPQALGPIGAGLQRLERVLPSAEAYVAAVRDAGAVSPWNEVWERHYRYELVEVPGGVRARTDAAAVREDLEYGLRHDARSYWSAVRQPALALRAARPLPQGGSVLNAADLARFGREVPHARRVEVDANHYGIMTHPDTVAALVQLFAA